MNSWDKSQKQKQKEEDSSDDEEPEQINVDIKSRIAAFQSNSTSNHGFNSNASVPQYATYQPRKSPVMSRPTAFSSATKAATTTTDPIQRHKSVPRDRDSNTSPSSLSSPSNDFVSEFGSIKGESKASTFSARSNTSQPWNLGGTGGGSATITTSSPFHLATRDEERQSKLRKSGSGLSMRELAAQSDAERRSRSNSTDSSRLSRRGSPVGANSGASSPRLGVKNIIALYGGNSGSGSSASGGLPDGSLGRSASPSSYSNSSAVNRNSSQRLGVSIPDASSSTDSVHVIPKRLPRHMLDASDDGSTSLQLHPTLCPSPSAQSPIQSGASSPAGDLLTSYTQRQAPASPRQMDRPPAPPRPPKPAASNTTAPSSTPPKLPSRFAVQPPTPSRHYTAEASRSSSQSPSRESAGPSGSAPLLPPRKAGSGSGSRSAGVSPSSTGDGQSLHYHAYTSRSTNKEQASTGPALPPRGNTSNSGSPASKEESTQRRSSADNASPLSKPPPLPRRSVGTSNSAASDLGISSSNGSSSSINLIPPPRHKAQPQHTHTKSSSSTFSSVSLTDNANAELQHSLESEIGDRSSLTGRNGLSSSSSNTRGPPLSPSNPLLPPPRAVRSLAQGAPSRTGIGLGSVGGTNPGFRFGAGTSQAASANRGRAFARTPSKPPKRSYTPDASSRARYESLFQRMLVAESTRKKKRTEKMHAGSKSGMSIPSRRDANRTITAKDEDQDIQAEMKNGQSLKGKFDQAENSARSRNNIMATSAPSERETSNPFLSSSGTSMSSSSQQSHRYTNSTGPGLESGPSSGHPFIPIRTVEKLFKHSKLSNKFLSEVFNTIIKHQDPNQTQGLEKEPFIRGLTAIDHELARRMAIRERRQAHKGNAGQASINRSAIGRNNTVRGNQRVSPRSSKSDALNANASTNWSDATRLPSAVKRVVPPPKPV